MRGYGLQHLSAYHNLVGCCHFSDFSRAQLAIFNIRGSSSTNSAGLRWCIHTDEDNICLGYCGVNVRREEQVPEKMLQSQTVFSTSFDIVE